MSSVVETMSKSTKSLLPSLSQPTKGDSPIISSQEVSNDDLSPVLPLQSSA